MLFFLVSPCWIIIIIVIIITTTTIIGLTLWSFSSYVEETKDYNEPGGYTWLPPSTDQYDNPIQHAINGCKKAERFFCRPCDRSVNISSCMQRMHSYGIGCSKEQRERSLHMCTCLCIHICMLFVGNSIHVNTEGERTAASTWRFQGRS